MYGILGSAMITASIALAVVRWAGARALTGKQIAVPPELGRGYRYWIGGAIFGAGWSPASPCLPPVSCCNRIRARVLRSALAPLANGPDTSTKDGTERLLGMPVVELVRPQLPAMRAPD